MTTELRTTPAAAPSSAKGMLTGMLATRGKWGRRAAEVWLAAEVAHSGWKKLKEKFATPNFTVSVMGDDPLFDDLHLWLVDQIPVESQTSLLVSVNDSRYDDEPVAVGSSTLPAKPSMMVAYDGLESQEIYLEGHKISVKVAAVPMGGSNVLINTDRHGKMKSLYRMTFTCETVEARDAVMRLLQELSDAYRQASRPPTFRMAGRWGGWDSRADLPTRSLDSIVLRDGQMDEIVDDLRHFLAREEVFVNAGVPWHRGYLLHGPPGTGKTSLARALATEFRLNVFYISLADLTEDSSLLSLVASMTPRSVLLLEDIDVAANAAIEREEGRNEAQRAEVSMSGLLNTLDGIVTPHGMVTIMTTNRREVLDEALLRPGRIDREFAIEYLEGPDIARLVKTVSGVGMDPQCFPEPMSPAAVVSAIIPHVGNDAMVQEVILGLVEQGAHLFPRRTP